MAIFAQRGPAPFLAIAYGIWMYGVPLYERRPITVESTWGVQFLSVAITTTAVQQQYTQARMLAAINIAVFLTISLCLLLAWIQRIRSGDEDRRLFRWRTHLSSDAAILVGVLAILACQLIPLFMHADGTMIDGRGTGTVKLAFGNVYFGLVFASTLFISGWLMVLPAAFRDRLD
ncbi:hypothetical protein G8E10_04875 [Rhizobiaceae bacterium CRRU44]|uniref:Uncharacterized protein n=1 Tax=Ferranicluibacter rubi TaxID=2715133 RepID=A0AA43ZDK2_9HYPH|nr:hypothetical protein [Ferranicluibacter rubi]NHT75090.1 hypothetical protein [Ferranicluibacter rubi]